MIPLLCLTLHATLSKFCQCLKSPRLMPATIEEKDHFERHLWEATHIITGPIDAADYKTYLFPILFFKRICDVYDEEVAVVMEEYGESEEFARKAEFHRFVVPEGHHWRDVHARTTNIGTALQKAFREIEKANDRLYGIFGDVQWTNKDRLPDSLLADLLEHYHRLKLGNRQVRQDRVGDAYEYLIKKFADVSNKAAGEFYTPRTVVRIMVNILDPQAGENVYDPACGTGGMLTETVHHVREAGGDHRLLKLKGQEKNLTTESIARMNLLLHGVEDFDIARGDTLREPAFHSDDRVEQFDCVIANPPFSLKKWGRDLWLSDPFGRNRFGLPSDNSGDFAWIAHMICSMKPDTGRVAVVMPNGALFRSGQEGKIRQAIIEADLLEGVIALGPNLFYGAGIPATVMVFRADKAEELKNHVYLVDASEILTAGRAQNFLTDDQSDEIYRLYCDKEDREGLTRLVPVEEIAGNAFNLSIARYVQKPVEEEKISVGQALKDFKSRMSHLEKCEAKVEKLLRKEGLLT